MLAAMRRLIQAEHVLRLEVQDERPRPPLPGLEPLAAGLGDQLASVEATLRARPEDPESPSLPEEPDLRARYLAFARAAPDDGDQEWLLAELDEIVDAANSLASLAGRDGDGSAGDGRDETAGVARASP